MKDIQSYLDMATTFRLTCTNDNYPQLRLFFMRLNAKLTRDDSSATLEGNCGFINNSVLSEIAQNQSLFVEITLFKDSQEIYKEQNGREDALLKNINSVVKNINDIPEISSTYLTPPVVPPPPAPDSIKTKLLPPKNESCRTDHAFSNEKKTQPLYSLYSVESIVKVLEKSRFTSFMVLSCFFLFFFLIISIIMSANDIGFTAFPVMVIVIGIVIIVSLVSQNKRKMADYHLSRFYHQIFSSCNIDLLAAELQNKVIYADDKSKIIITEHYILGYRNTFVFANLDEIIYAGGNLTPGKGSYPRLTMVLTFGKAVHTQTASRKHADEAAAFLGRTLQIRYGEYESLLRKYHMNYYNFPKPEFVDTCRSYKSQTHKEKK